MKKIALLLTIVLVSLSVYSQDEKYLKAMAQTIELMENEPGSDQYLKCANQFERIAMAEKTKWLPFYYSAYALVVMSFDEPDGGEKDLILDRAQPIIFTRAVPETLEATNVMTY